MIHLKKKKKIALALSGGGIKAAAFHIGVCLALQEKGFRFIGGSREQVEDSPHVNDPMAIKTYVGSSAGSLVTAMLASGHSLETIIESFEMGSGLIGRQRRRTKLKPLSYLDIFSVNAPDISNIWTKIFKQKKAIISGGLETILKNNFKINGFFNTKGLEHYLRTQVLPTNSFGELGVELFVVATLLNHSRKAVFTHKTAPKKSHETSYVNHVTISDAVAASTSLPPAFAPYAIKDPEGEVVHYFDGEIRDTLSTHVAADWDADLVISSYSIQPYHYTSEVGTLNDYGLPLIINQALYQVVEQKIKKSIQAREDIKNIVHSVSGYFKENNLPQEHADRLVNILCKKVGYRRDVDYIYIHPKPQNHEMFFVDHFSLNPEILERIVKIGFKSAINVLRKFDV